MCNFGSEDKSEIVPQDMQTLLKSIPKKMKKKAMQKKNSPKYDAFPVNKAVRPMTRCIAQDFC